MTDTETRQHTNALLIEFANEIQELKRRVACLERDNRRLAINYCEMKLKCKTWQRDSNVSIT